MGFADSRRPGGGGGGWGGGIGRALFGAMAMPNGPGISVCQQSEGAHSKVANDTTVSIFWV